MRRKIKRKNKIKPDYKYDSNQVEMFTNYIMKSGKKSVARKIVYDALDDISKTTKKDAKDAVEIFEKALHNTTPLVEVRSRRVGGANYQVPKEVAPNRGLSLAMRWIIASAKAKKGQPMYKKLSNELLLASKNEGDAMKKRETVHKMADSNKAFAHFAW